MEDFTFSSVGATFQKWGCYTHTPKEAQALTTCKGLQKNKIKGAKKREGEAYIDKLQPIVGGQSLVAMVPNDWWSPTRWPWTDQWSPGLGQPVVNDCWSGQLLATASCHPLLCRSPFLVLSLPLLSYLLLPNFCTCGQLFIFGSNTCPSCPNFS